MNNKPSSRPVPLHASKEELLEQIDILHAQIEQLKLAIPPEEAALEETEVPRFSESQRHRATKASDLFATGDTVEITNNYNNLQGVKGTVLKLTSTQVVIDIGKDKPPQRRHFQNVKGVPHKSTQYHPY